MMVGSEAELHRGFDRVPARIDEKDSGSEALLPIMLRFGMACRFLPSPIFTGGPFFFGRLANPDPLF